MLVVTGSEMAAIERKAIDSLGFSPLLMMENAGNRIVETIKAEYGCVKGKRLHILVGTGNNGGDGLVAARLLLTLGARPKVYLVGNPSKLTKENSINLELVRKLGIDLVRVEGRQINQLKFSLALADLLIDAILGTGFSGSLGSDLSSIVALVNEVQRPLIAIDVPTGVDASTGEVRGEAIKADLTINLGACKVGCVLYPGKHYAGKTVLVDLGLPLPDLAIRRRILGEETLDWLPERPPWGHKGTFGHTLVVAGSRNYAGAAALSGQAALRSGSGLVTVVVPAGIYGRFQPNEMIVVPVVETESGAVAKVNLERMLELMEGKDSLVLGPGLSQDPEVHQLVQSLLIAWEGPAILDADALLALTPDFLGQVPLEKRQNWVLTPHPGEMARLIDSDPASVNHSRLAVARDFAKTWGVVLVLKGAPTIIADANMTYINSTGNHGLGTGGSGDVLSGIIGSFLGQGAKALQAAALGVYLHGQAGDLAALKGARGLVASDCLLAIQEAIG